MSELVGERVVHQHFESLQQHIVNHYACRQEELHNNLFGIQAFSTLSRHHHIRNTKPGRLSHKDTECNL